MEPEHDQDVSFEPRISTQLRTRRRPDFQHQPSRKRVGLGLPPHRVVLLCLGLLDTALLIAALVLGMYCAKATDFKVASDSDFVPLLIELNLLQNQSKAIKANQGQDAQVDAENYMQLQVQLKQEQVITDSLQSHIQALRAEKAQLESNKTALEANCGRCPVGWILLKTSCYFYSNNPSNARKNWLDSRADCVSRGGDLLVVNTLEEQRAINNNYPKVLGTGILWKMGFWIGLSDPGTNGQWIWVNNATENSAMYWQNGQPSSEAGHCAAFGRNILSWRSWYNRNCENDKLNWICEMEPR